MKSLYIRRPLHTGGASELYVRLFEKADTGRAAKTASGFLFFLKNRFSYAILRDRNS